MIYTLDWRLAVVSILVAFICSMGTTWYSCKYELTSMAADLIRTKAPKSGKRIALERVTWLWNRLGFLQKVSIRNLVRYKKRFFMMVFGISGSFGIGLLDTRISNRKAMIIATCLMVIASVLCAIGSGTTLLIAMIFVALFMGAASNVGVSCAAQYWRREDFGRIFMLSSPIGSHISGAAPVVSAGRLFGVTGYKGATGVLSLVGICGVIALGCMLIFNASHIKANDDKLRANAGKETDHVLSGRK